MLLEKNLEKSYLDYEIYSHCWVQITINDAQLFKSGMDVNGNKLMMGCGHASTNMKIALS